MNPVEGQQDVQRIVEAIVFLYTEGRRVTKGVARQHGLTGPQVTALKMLQASDGMSLSGLSARMSARNSTITGIVDRMEKQELVRRVRSDEDRRVVCLHLTDEGRKMADTIPVSSIEIFADALSSLPEDDRNELRRILSDLSDRVRDEVERREEDKNHV
jgi:DNA-binding MarR family transcriptional regulator